MVCQPYYNVICPGWPRAAPPGAGAPAPPRIASVTTASTTSGRRVSIVTGHQPNNNTSFHVQLKSCYQNSYHSRTTTVILRFRVTKIS